MPEALAPVAFADVFEFLLDLARGSSLGPAHEVADRYVGRDLDEHVHVITRQSPVDDGHAHLIADLLDDFTHTQTHLAVQHPIPILRRPDEMIAVMKRSTAKPKVV